MPRLDDIALDRLVDKRLEQEPALHRHPRCVRPHPEVMEAMTRSRAQAVKLPMPETDSVGLSCPACHGSVFVPRDSDGEHVSCDHCGADLITMRAIDGVYLHGKGG